MVAIVQSESVPADTVLIVGGRRRHDREALVDLMDDPDTWGVFVMKVTKTAENESRVAWIRTSRFDEDDDPYLVEAIGKLCEHYGAHAAVKRGA